MGNPYEQALEQIKTHKGASSSTGLGKLILSLWNARMAFSYRECTHNFDRRLDNIALQIIQHFTINGEDDALIAAGDAVIELYPELWDIGIEGTRAKEDFKQARRS